MSQASNSFYDAIQLLHPNMELDAEDISTYFQFYGQTLHDEQQRNEVALYKPEVRTNVIIYPIRNGKVVGIVASSAAAFLSGGIVGGAIALAGGLFSLFTSKPDKRNQDDDNYGPNYGFDSGGDLTPVGGPIPIIYCDRDTNPSGGVRAGGYLINARIDTCLGTNTLYQQYALCIGELGFIDEDSTLFDEQPRRNFTVREIETYKRDGTELQTAMPEFPYYSQVITPPSYNVFGVDLRTTVSSITPWVPGDSNDVTNVTVVGGTITEGGGVNGVYDSGLFSNESIITTGFLQFVPGSIGEYAAGLSSANADNDYVSIEFGVRFKPSGLLDIVESGIVVVNNIPYTPGTTTVRITVTATGQVVYNITGATPYTSLNAPTLPIFADFAFATSGSSITNTAFNYTGGGGAIVPPGGTVTSTIGISEEEDDDTNGAYERMNPSDDYFLKKFPIGYSYYITDKDLDSRTLTITPSVPLADGDEIWARWVTRYETTKRVNQIHVNLSFSLSAIDKEENTNRVHGSLFDLYLSPVVNNIINLQFIRRFYVRGERSGSVRRGFNIINLPLGRYYFELRPIPCNPRSLNDGVGLDVTDGFGIVHGGDPDVEDGVPDCYGTECGFYSGSPDAAPNCPVVYPTSGVDTPEPDRATGTLFGDPIYPGGSVEFKIELPISCSEDGAPGPDTLARMCFGVAPEAATYDPTDPLNNTFEHYFCARSPERDYPFDKTYDTGGFPTTVNGEYTDADTWRFEWDGTTLTLLKNNVVINSVPYNPGGAIRFGFTTLVDRQDTTPADDGACGNRICIESFDGNDPVDVDPGINEFIQGNVAVTELTDSGECFRLINPLVDITSPQTGQTLPVLIEGDLGGDPGDGEIDKGLTYEDKTQVSSENGPTGKITSINEVVTLDAIGQTLGDNSYPNIALVAHKFLASSRMQSPPGHSVLVRRGRRIRNHVDAGVVEAGSNNITLVDTSANFIGQGVQTGMVIRNLTQRTEAQIIAVTNTTITADAPLNWQDKGNVSCGDRYLVYFVDSSAYFPDIFCDLLQNPINCLGEYIDADRFIDYPSIVDSRNFCANNGYFWDDVIEGEVNFAQFVTTESKGSLLYPVKIDGRYGLTPERYLPPVAVFNGSNIESFSEEYIDWAQLLPNKIVVTFTDGRNDFKTDGARFRPQSVIIQTNDSFTGVVPEVEQSLSLPAVTNEAQAIRVAQIYLQSLIHQDRQISFTTDLQALYFLAGDLIIVQTVNTEFSDELSGFVKSVITPFAGGSQTVTLSNSSIVYRGKATTTGTDVLTDSGQDFTQMPFQVGDLLVKDQTSEYGLITAVGVNTIETDTGLTWVQYDCYSIERITLNPTDYKASALFRDTGTVSDNLQVTSQLSPDGEHQITVSGLTEPLNILDPVVVGRNVQDEQLYRVTEVSPTEDGKIKISATKWDRVILTDTDLITITQAEGV
jgi:hypothetical protein